jgi:serine/threonine protein kinase
LQALSFLHARRVVHRDVKPENVMLCKAGGDAIVLADFGISADLERLIQTTTAATVGPSPLSYGAPSPKGLDPLPLVRGPGIIRARHLRTKSLPASVAVVGGVFTQEATSRRQFAGADVRMGRRHATVHAA